MLRTYRHVEIECDSSSSCNEVFEAGPGVNGYRARQYAKEQERRFDDRWR